MDRVILVRYAEIALKGQNRPVFEKKLVTRMKKVLRACGGYVLYRSQARIYIEPAAGFDTETAAERMTKIFGIASVSIALKVNSDINAIKQAAVEAIKGKANVDTFKVETRRGDKRFPFLSPEISATVGEFVLENVPGISVDVNNPDVVVFVEVRESSYIYTDIRYGQGGIPTGTGGKAVLLLSGGIDSPVAGWMMAKRGVQIEAVHFYSFPYTGERSKEKVIDLCKILSGYCGRIRLHIVPFTDIQLSIRDRCPEEQMTIIMRRMMMVIAEEIARATGAKALITGESLGQVASQTMESISVTDSAVGMSVFRPCIGFDKKDIIEMAREIGTYETSILPYDDCCTVFLPRHPKTKPRLEKIIESETHLDTGRLVEEAFENRDVILIEDGAVKV